MKVYDENGRPLIVGARVVGAHGVGGEILDIDFTDRDADPGEIAGYLDVAWDDTGEADALPIDATNDPDAFVCFDCATHTSRRNREHEQNLNTIPIHIGSA